MYKAQGVALFLFCLSAPSVANDTVVTGIVENVRIVHWGYVDTRPDETFITLDNGHVFRFPSHEPVGIGQKFKVEIRVPHNARKREDGSITACAAQIIALSFSLNGKETLYPVDKKVWIAPLQEDGCSYKKEQSNKAPQPTPKSGAAEL